MTLNVSNFTYHVSCYKPPFHCMCHHDSIKQCSLKKKAFTLIELMVVIAVIAVLTGVLIPVLGRARKQAWKSVCMSNMRQIGVGAALYAQDNDYAVPRGADAGNKNIWFKVFMPYLAQEKDKSDYRDVEIYRCPAYPDKEQTVCYVINGWEFSSKYDMTGTEIVNVDAKFKLTSHHRLSETIYLADNEDGEWRPIIKTADDPGINVCDVWHPDHLPMSTSIRTNISRRVARERHRQGCNVLYSDWHVEWMGARTMTINMWRYHH